MTDGGQAPEKLRNPGLRIFRVFRMVRVWRLLPVFGIRRMWVWLLHERAQSAP